MVQRSFLAVQIKRVECSMYLPVNQLKLLNMTTPSNALNSWIRVTLLPLAVGIKPSDIGILAHLNLSALCSFLNAVMPWMPRVL